MFNGPAFGIDTLSADPNFYAHLGRSIWLMDNHKWALFIWSTAKTLSSGTTYSLVHADYHWDAVDDFYEQPELVEELRTATDEELRGLTAQDAYIKWDSFIAPAIHRGMLREVHFLC